MAGDQQSQKVEVPQGGQIEKKEGLAQIARLILEKIFRNTSFEKFYDSIREKYNLVASGKGTPADVKFLNEAIEKHEAEVKKTYSPDVVEIAGNYLRKLKLGIGETPVEDSEMA